MSTAVVSIIASSAVAIVALGANVWQHVRGLAHDRDMTKLRLSQDRTLADLAAVRDVIERGAVHLHLVAYALDRSKQDLEGNAGRTYSELDKLGREYDELVERLKVRLGPDHDAVREFVDANAATLDAYRAIERVVKLHLPHIEQGGSGANQARTLLDNDRARLTDARERFDSHRTAFIEAAARTAGAKLPTS
jgi:hypothetical protein